MRKGLSKLRISVVISVIIFILAGTCFSQNLAGDVLTAQEPVLSENAADDIPENGTEIISRNWISSVSCYKNTYGEIKLVDVSGQSFSKAVQVKTAKQPKNIYDLGITIPVIKPVKMGDVILAVFYARTVDSSLQDKKARVEFVFEQSKSPWEKSIMVTVGPEKTWKKYYIPFKAAMDYVKIPAHISLRMGYKPQNIEIGGIEFFNYGKDMDIGKLPYTKMTYDGRETGAPWRKAALERIEKYRKAEMNLQVTDKNGKPVSGAEVDVKLVKHDFAFGTAVDSSYITGNRKDMSYSKRYRDEVKKLFNMVVIENDMKWPNWENSDKKACKSTVEWLKENGLRLRGHNLIWDDWQYLPSDLKRKQNDRNYIRKRINEHLKEEAGYFKGKLVEWDVVNEPLSCKNIRNMLGDREMTQWYKEVRRIDPSARLYLNEWGLEGYEYSGRLDDFIKLLDGQLKNGAPIDAIGIQGHFEADPPSPEAFLKAMDRLATLGLELEVTEFDFATMDEQLQADYTRDILIAAYSHPDMKGFIMWGFWDGAHWKKNAPIFRTDWSMKPSGKVWNDLIFKKWDTKVAGKTDDGGRMALRGFKGEYTISIKYKGAAKVLRASLTKDSSVSVKLDVE